MPKLIKRTNCIMGIYDDDTVFMHAVKALKSHKLEIKNAYTPFPVHGLDKAMGLRESKLGYVAFLFGCLGGMTALGLMSFAMFINWPLNIGGKPSLPLPSFIPITFELTVLFSALGMIAVYFLRNQMLPGFEPKIYHLRSTQDHFVVLVEESNMGPDIEKLMKDSGAIDIKKEEYLEQTAPLPVPVIMK